MSQRSKIHTVVLTSSENYVWTSMQEIIPSVEEVWKISASKSHTVNVIDVDNKSIAQIFSAVLRADNIVFTCFTSKLSIIARRIRSDLQIFPRYIFHLHSLATIALWPVYKWGMGEVLQKQDIFISTCERDKECFRISVPEGIVKVIPFSLSELERSQTNNSSPLVLEKSVNFVYVGRISSQKNIHTLIVAFHQLLIDNTFNEQIVLHIFGGEDNLGSPNMESYRMGYENFLQDLIESLNIEDHVILHGFIDRHILHNNYLKLPHILVSSSLHSDENFGIAALRSLADGNRAVLSDWGGHTDYKLYFSNQVTLSPVYTTPHGPVINPLELSVQLKSALSHSRSDTPVLPKRYQKSSIAKELYNIACSDTLESEKLEVSDVISKILGRQQEYFNSTLNDRVDIPDRRRGCKIFKDYSDKLAHLFFRSYGMVNEIPPVSSNKAFIPPWVTITESKILVSDYHRGNFIFKKTDGEWLLFDHKQEFYRVSESIFNELVQSGFAFKAHLE